MKRILLMALIVWIAGYSSGGCCSKEEADKDTASVGDVIDYATGKTPIEQGKRMEQDIKSIQREHDEQVKKIMEQEE